MTNKKFNFVLVNYNSKSFHLAAAVSAHAIKDFDCDGIEEFSLEEARVDEILGERAYSGGDIPETLLDEVVRATEAQAEITYKYFFYQNNFEENTDDFVKFIAENFPGLPTYTTQKNMEDWNAEWKKFYCPIIVSERLEIIPEWLRDSGNDDHANKVYIYPGMGFGTGTHETTYLCLKLFDEIVFRRDRPMRCLDFGCGSGILGITAMKIQKMATVFCDIDKDALDNCVQNLLLNFEGEDVSGTRLVSRDRYTEEKFDLVFANILLHVLILEKKVILNSLAPGGYVVISGLLNHQVDEIASAFDSLEMLQVVSKGDWSAILLRSRG